jgi:hypothetical protein
MTTLKSVLATGWAALATPLVLATFMGNGALSHWLARATGVVVSPWYTGGEVARQIEHTGYRTLVRRPIFDALVGQRPEGFVQVEWLPAQGASLPETLREAIDYDGDGVADFTIDLGTRSNTATLTPHTPRVLGLERVYRLEREKVVRVRLRRE